MIVGAFLHHQEVCQPTGKDTRSSLRKHDATAAQELLDIVSQVLAQRWHPAIPHSQARSGQRQRPWLSNTSSSFSSSSSESVLVLDDGMAGGEGGLALEGGGGGTTLLRRIQLHAPSPHPDKEFKVFFGFLNVLSGFGSVLPVFLVLGKKNVWARH